MDQQDATLAAAAQDITLGLPQDTASWGPQLENHLDLTLFFEQVVFNLIPSIIFIICAIYYVRRVWNAPRVAKSGNLFWFKLACGVVLFAAITSRVCLFNSHEHLHTTIAVISGVATVVAALCINLAIFAEHFYSVRPSHVLSVYLALTVLFNAAETYSLFNRELQNESIASIVILVGKTILIALEEVPKRQLFLSKELQLSTGREAVSGFWSRTFYTWLNATFVRGYRAILKVEDLDKLDSALKSSRLSKIFIQYWETASTSGNYALLSSLFCTVGPLQITITVVTCLMSVAIKYSQPLIIKQVIQAMEQPDLSRSAIAGLIAACSLSYAGTAITRAVNQQAVARSNTAFRSCSIAAIYGKSLVLDPRSLQTGKPLTLITTDVTGLQSLPARLNGFLSYLASIIGGIIYLGCHEKRTAAVVLIPLFVSGFLSFLLSKKIRSSQMDWNASAEQRIAAIDSFLTKFKSIRMAGLGIAFSKLVDAKLETEVKASKTYRFFNALLFLIDLASITFTPPLILGVTFTLSASGWLVSANTYPLVAVGILISEPLGRFIHSFSHIAKAIGCHDRIQDFLYHHEIVDVRGGILQSPNNNQTLVADNGVKETAKVAAMLVNVGTAPIPEGDQILQDINATIPANQLTIVTGPISSGKSTVAKLLLGEVEIVEGKIGVADDSIAYCSQVPWIQSGSVRSNIIGQNAAINTAWYQTVIDACCLNTDFSNWPEGDATEVGNRGTKLSGGQKHRIALARAVYSRNSIVLLDDVFSGLDPDTAARVFNNLLGNNGIWRQSETTVILATNSVDYFASAGRIIRLNHRSVITEIIEVPAQYDIAVPVTEPINTPVAVEQALMPQISVSTQSGESRRSRSNEEFRLSTSEPKIRTSKPISTGRFYFNSFGANQIFIWLILIALGELLFKTPNIYLRIWYQDHEAVDSYFLRIYSLISAASVVFSTLTIGWFLARLIATSYHALHKILFDATLKANFQFIAKTDHGSILNRFSQDMVLVSQELPYLLLHAMMYFFATLVDLGIIASSANYAIVAIVAFLAFLLIVKRFYIRTSCQMRVLQLEGMTPIYNLFTETASGIEHIRAFKWQAEFEKKLMEKLDAAQVPHYQMLCIQQWLYLVLDLGVCGLATIILCLAFLIPEQSSSNGVGLALVNMITVSQSVANGLRIWVDYETSLGAISRTQEFARLTPQEPQPKNGGDANRLCPTHGAIKFDKISIRFDPDNTTSPRILSDISFTAQPGQRIGIIGRTGSGKSSLMMAALKMMEYSGVLKIDGTSIRQISGETLRSRITVIGQESTILPGSVRYNLHPYATAEDVVDDKKMIEILSKVGLWQHLESHGALDACVASLELSEGQQQLLNIARGMIHHIHGRTKIVFLDEVTSHLDLASDEQVYRAIDEVFDNCTMLVITHRHENLQEMDAILTVANGSTSLVSQTRRSHEPPSAPEEEVLASASGTEVDLLPPSRGRELFISKGGPRSRHGESEETVRRTAIAEVTIRSSSAEPTHPRQPLDLSIIQAKRNQGIVASNPQTLTPTIPSSSMDAASKAGEDGGEAKREGEAEADEDEGGELLPSIAYVPDSDTASIHSTSSFSSDYWARRDEIDADEVAELLKSSIFLRREVENEEDALPDPSDRHPSLEPREHASPESSEGTLLPSRKGALSLLNEGTLTEPSKDMAAGKESEEKTVELLTSSVFRQRNQRCGAGTVADTIEEASEESGEENYTLTSTEKIDLVLPSKSRRSTGDGDAQP